MPIGLVYTSMIRDFISLYQLGIGPVPVRYSEIVHMEPLIDCATRVYLSNAASIIVSEDIVTILRLIRIQTDLNESIENTQL